MLKLNQKAPDFKLCGDDEFVYTLSGYKGSWVVLYFYPKDDTPGCTRQACSIRDSYSEFDELGVTVFGISIDSVQSHRKFKEKYSLPFILLSDIDQELIQEYEAQNALGGTSRMTYVINPEGVIAKIYPKVDPSTHGEQLLSDIKNLMN